MTKILIVIFLFLVLLGLVLLRFRKQIQTALYVLQMFRKMRQASQAQSENQIERKETPGDGKLVRCARCGTWIPQINAIDLRSGNYYCSANCIENAVSK